MAAMTVLEAVAFGRGGSSPSIRTISCSEQVEQLWSSLDQSTEDAAVAPLPRDP